MGSRALAQRQEQPPERGEGDYAEPDRKDGGLELEEQQRQCAGTDDIRDHHRRYQLIDGLKLLQPHATGSGLV